MKKSILLVILVYALISCEKKVNSVVYEEMIEANIEENLNIQTSHFFEIDSTGVLIFPLTMGENIDRNSNSSYKKMPYNGYWNILFYNTLNNETNLLTESKMLILDFDLKYNQNTVVDIPKGLNHIFYKVRANDFNNDRLLNEKDPIYLYVSDKFGNNFRQISPTNHNLINWSYIEKSNKIILTASKDSNKNHEFDENDEFSTFEITLNKEEKSKEIFENKLKKKLKILYDRDWKKIE